MSGFTITWDQMPAEMREIFLRIEKDANGVARHVLWGCEDGWQVGYTTERVDGGPLDGRFAVMAYRPTGKGSRSGNAENWRRVYFRGFAKRKTARARALVLYYRHSPRAAKRGEHY